MNFSCVLRMHKHRALVHIGYDDQGDAFGGSTSGGLSADRNTVWIAAESFH